MTDYVNIGIDHGNARVDTRHKAIKTGVAEHFGKPPVDAKHLVQYDNAFYVCGSAYGNLQEDKTLTNDYWIQTLCAIGAELQHRKIKPDLKNGIDIYISAGLPLTYPDSEKRSFRKYLNRGTVDFRYNNKRYIINIKDAFIWAQGLSGILGAGLTEVWTQPVFNCVDIGSWTVLPFSLHNGVVNQNTFKTLPKIGTYKCTNDIREQINRNSKHHISIEQIEAVLWSGKDAAKKIIMPPDIKRQITQYAAKYTEFVMSEVLKNGFDCTAAPMVFMGGGARLIKYFYKNRNMFYPKYITDTHCNAIGYEMQTEAILKKKRGL